MSPKLADVIHKKVKKIYYYYRPVNGIYFFLIKFCRSNNVAFLPTFLETWKCAVEKGKAFCPLLSDLSKAFNCLDHELLIRFMWIRH